MGSTVEAGKKKGINKELLDRQIHQENRLADKEKLLLAEIAGISKKISQAKTPEEKAALIKQRNEKIKELINVLDRWQNVYEKLMKMPGLSEETKKEIEEAYTSLTMAKSYLKSYYMNLKAGNNKEVEEAKGNFIASIKEFNYLDTLLFDHLQSVSNALEKGVHEKKKQEITAGQTQTATKREDQKGWTGGTKKEAKNVQQKEKHTKEGYEELKKLFKEIAKLLGINLEKSGEILRQIDNLVYKGIKEKKIDAKRFLTDKKYRTNLSPKSSNRNLVNPSLPFYHYKSAPHSRHPLGDGGI